MTIRTTRARGTATALITAAVLAVTAVPATAQDDAAPTFSPEDLEKGAVLTEFLENLDEWLPTVNHIDPESLPVTFSFEDVSSHIVLDMVFEGGDPLTVFLDTGGATTVTQEVADASGGEVLVEMLNRAAGGSFLWLPIQQYPPLTVEGALTVTEPTAQVGWAAAGDFYCFGRDGLLGATAMRNAVWQIDFGTNEITVGASVDQLDHIADAIALPFTVGGSGISPTPHVEVGIGDGTLDFAVDSGGAIPLTVGPEQLASVGVEVPDDAPLTAGLGFGAAGPVEGPASATITLPVTIGGAEFEAPVFVNAGFAPTSDGNMGYKFLENFVVTIDWSTSTMYLEPLSEDGVAALDDPAPATIAWLDGDLVVGSLQKGASADEAGLAVGEVITSVDGESVEGLTLDQYCADIVGQPHQSLTTASGTYDLSPVEGFFESSTDE